MPPPPAMFLGIDVGREALGMVVLGADAQVVGALSRSYSGTPGTTSDPQDWWRAARTGIKELLRRCKLNASAIRSIGVTGDSTGFAAIDREGKSLSSVTLGPQPDAETYVDQLIRTVGARNLLNLAAGPADSSATAVKLLWLRENQRRAWHDTAQILPAKDFLRFRLTGAAATDAYDAVATLLCNPKARTWSKLLLTQLDINPAWMPPIASAQAIAGRVTPDAARDSGLQAGTPVVTGGGRVASAAIALGVTSPSSALIQLGGDGALFIPTAESVRDPSQRLISTCHALAGVWGLVGPNLCSDSPLQWLMREVMIGEVSQAKRAKRDPMDILAELAAEVPPGSEGLRFLSPGVQRNPGFHNLSPAHTRGHLVRAVLESGPLAVRMAFDAARDLKRAPERILVTGPSCRTTLWCQILADAIGQPITVYPGLDREAVGAAILAGLAVGTFSSLEQAATKASGKGTTYQPRKAATEAYEAILPGLAQTTGGSLSGLPLSAAEAAS